jgi:hypothetical protein
MQALLTGVIHGQREDDTRYPMFWLFRGTWGLSGWNIICTRNIARNVLMMEANLHDRENEEHGSESFPFFARMLRRCGVYFAG